MPTSVPGTATFAPAPMSLSELRRYVVDYVQGGNDAELLDVATRSINRAIDRLNASRRWLKVNGKQEITTVLGQADYELYFDFADPLECTQLDINGNPVGRLAYKPFQAASQEDPCAVELGSPYFYTIYFEERLFSLNRPPAQSWIDRNPFLRVRYHRRFMHMHGDNPNHGGPAEFDAYIGWCARGEIAAVRGDQSAAAMAMNEARMILRSLTLMDNEIHTDWDA